MKIGETIKLFIFIELLAIIMVTIMNVYVYFFGVYFDMGEALMMYPYISGIFLGCLLLANFVAMPLFNLMFKTDV